MVVVPPCETEAEREAEVRGEVVSVIAMMMMRRRRRRGRKKKKIVVVAAVAEIVSATLEYLGPPVLVLPRPRQTGRLPLIWLWMPLCLLLQLLMITMMRFLLLRRRRYIPHAAYKEEDNNSHDD